MIRRLLIFVMLVLGFFVLFSTSVNAVPALPSFFYGNLIINEEDAPIGTEVVTKIDGEVRGRIVTSEFGKYGKDSGNPKLLVEGEESDDGKSIVFLIDGVEAEQRGNWVSGKITKLDLSVKIDDQQTDDHDDEEEEEDESNSDNDDENLNIVNLDYNNPDSGSEEGNDDIITNVGAGDDENLATEERGTMDELLIGDFPLLMITLVFSILVLVLASVIVLKKVFF